MNKIHLVVFVHGMMGSRAHSVYVSERLVRKYPNIQTVRLIHKSNTRLFFLTDNTIVYIFSKRRLVDE